MAAHRLEPRIGTRSGCRWPPLASRYGPTHLHRRRPHARRRHVPLVAWSARALGLKATSAAALRRHAVTRSGSGSTTATSPGSRRWTDDDLAAAVAGSRNWAQVAVALGLAGGSSISALKGHATRLGLDTATSARRRR